MNASAKIKPEKGFYFNGMSFSSGIKQEITEIRIRRSDDAAALLSAFTLAIANLKFVPASRSWGLHFVSESESAILFVSKLASQYYSLDFRVSRVEHERLNAVCHELLLYGEHLDKFMLDTGFMTVDGNGESVFSERIPVVSIRTDTQKKAFIRGLFLACGTATEPKKAYHAEFVIKNHELLEYARTLLMYFGVNAKYTRRKTSEILYIKDGESFEDFLALLGASSAMMEAADTRIVKQANNEANRSVNCINANLDRTARSAVRQIDDIKLVTEALGFDGLPEPLRAVAEARINNYELTLGELAEVLGIGKSAVNYRLRKLSEMAADIRMGNGGK